MIAVMDEVLGRLKIKSAIMATERDRKDPWGKKPMEK